MHCHGEDESSETSKSKVVLKDLPLSSHVNLSKKLELETTASSPTKGDKYAYPRGPLASDSSYNYFLSHKGEGEIVYA